MIARLGSMMSLNSDDFGIEDAILYWHESIFWRAGHSTGSVSVL